MASQHWRSRSHLTLPEAEFLPRFDLRQDMTANRTIQIRDGFVVFRAISTDAANFLIKNNFIDNSIELLVVTSRNDDEPPSLSRMNAFEISVFISGFGRIYDSNGLWEICMEADGIGYIGVIFDKISVEMARELVWMHDRAIAESFNIYELDDIYNF
mgnify:CR=1 FL=1